MKFLALLSAASTLLAFGANAAVHGLHGAGHGELARRLSGEVDLNSRGVQNSKWSYYDTETGNAGSCGRMISNGEYVVAMNANDYNPSNCFRKIVMTYGGKTTTASVGDRCPGCPPGGLDLSTGLFGFFASHDKGIIYGSWEWADEAAAPAPAPAPPKTTTKQWTPTSTWTPPKPTTPAWTPEPSPVWTPEPTPTPTPTSTKESSTQRSSSSSSSTPVTSSSSSSSVPPPSSSAASSSSASSAAASPSATPEGNVETINGLVVQFGELMVVGAYAN